MENELFVRLSVFLSVFLSMALLELLIPYRKLVASKTNRWFNNILLLIFNSVAIRLLFPLVAVQASVLANDNAWGLFNYYPTITCHIISISNQS